jgi:hypothetical protein
MPPKFGGMGGQNLIHAGSLLFLSVGTLHVTSLQTVSLPENTPGISARKRDLAVKHHETEI